MCLKTQRKFAKVPELTVTGHGYTLQLDFST